METKVPVFPANIAIGARMKTNDGRGEFTTYSARADYLRGIMLSDFAALDRLIARHGLPNIDIDCKYFGKELNDEFKKCLHYMQGAREAFNCASLRIFGVIGPQF